MTPRRFLPPTLLTLFVALVASAALAQGPEEPSGTDNDWTVIIFHNGNRIRGEIIPARPGEAVTVPESGWINFRTESGTRMRYNVDRIREVILPEQRQHAVAGEMIAEIRQIFYIQADLLGALEETTRLHAIAPNNPEVLELCWEIGVAVYEQAQELTDARDFASAFRHWDALINHFQETGLRFENPTPEPGEAIDLTHPFERDLVAALQTRVEGLITEAELHDPVDLDLLREALVLNQRLLQRVPHSLPAHLNAIDITEARGDLRGALRQVETLRNSMDSMPGITRHSQDLVNLRIQDLQRRVDGGQGPTHPPSPLPGILDGLGTGRADPTAPTAPSTPPSLTVPPPPSVDTTPPPTPAPSSRIGLWPRLKRRLTDRDFAGAFADIREWVEDNSRITYPAGIALLALFFLWVLPYKIAARRARAGGIIASMWAPRLKRYGPFAIAGLILSPLGKLIPGSARRHRALVKEVGELCPHCAGILENVELYRDLRFDLCPHCREEITPLYDLTDHINQLIIHIDHVRAGRSLGADALENEAHRDTMLRLVKAVMTQAVRQRASDLHVDASGDGLDLRIRVDGSLRAMDIHISKAVERAFVSAIKVMANLDITERRAPQDGRFEIDIDGSSIDIRINTSPTGLGEKISMRLLDIRSVRVPLGKLGISAGALPMFTRSIHSPNGLILVTGPTGSGKSTTLYVALNEINSGKRNIVTIEDPIEFIFKGLNQHQVNPAANFTFATGLRSIIRQDPDVIMVGEIRDNETADIAVNAATTGHLVLTTLHTNDAAAAYPRLAEFGVDSSRFAPVMLIIVAQRLLALNCERCKEPHTPSPATLSALEIPDHDIIFYRGIGCEHCLETGLHGRTGLFEILEVTPEICALMEGKSPVNAVRETARRAGMRTIREEGLIRVMEGFATPEEVLRVIS
jgi:type II secretory ATPase GspE/PulE/Tfp pilus assembly ATPase PilB-like protein